MTFAPPSNTEIAVIGLGYVGLPLALALARHFPVVGYDSNANRLGELRNHEDRTGETPPQDLRASALNISGDCTDLTRCNVFIVTVPTPIDAANAPDLSALRAASRAVGEVMPSGAVVVFESTVYPGVTEDVCGPELERASGMVCGRDFFLGYSPERINPGDTKHTVENIVKVVAGQTEDVARLLADVYGTIVGAGIHIAPDIRTAEAAKVIENAQRDINIAFVNEVSMIFHRMGIDTQEVLAAARTKWNFLDFRPGLVGGHCIGVDPYYLAHAATSVGYQPEIILSGRRINDGMARFIADAINGRLDGASRVLVLGLTFKENVPDLRNSKVADLIGCLRDAGHDVDTHDPVAVAAEAEALYGIELKTELHDGPPYDAVIGAVAHAAYAALSDEQLQALVSADGLLFDLKGIWRERNLADGIQVWHL